MGCAASTPVVEDGQTGPNAKQLSAAPAGRGDSDLPPLPDGVSRIAKSAPAVAAVAHEDDCSLPSRSVSFDMLGQVQQMQRQLALVNPVPALGLLEAAELLARWLKAPLVR